MEKLSLSLVDDFRSQECAVLAIHIIMEKQQAGFSYREILECPGFIGLFAPEFLQNKNEKQLVIKLKNIVRDVRDSKKDYSILADAQSFFRNRKRKKAYSSLLNTNIVRSANRPGIMRYSNHFVRCTRLDQ